MLDLDPGPDIRITGKWSMTRAEYEGERAPEAVVSLTTLEFSGRVYRVRFQGKIMDEGAFELHLNDEPKKLTLVGSSGTNAGRTIRAIFQLVGDRLRVCYGMDGIRPTDFITKPGQKRYLATYRRVPI